jgi:hypothetical protein
MTFEARRQSGAADVKRSWGWEAQSREFSALQVQAPVLSVARCTVAP